MATSQNGWPVATAGEQDTSTVAGVAFPNGVLKGDVATVLHKVADLYHRTVEPLVKGTCWGWYVKPIEGSSTISNHASGTAIDFNADQHPMGVAASQNFTAAQIKACHAIVSYCDGVVRWGGDYSGRPDPMHWEIVGTPAQVKKLADKIRGEFEMTDEDMRKLAGYIGEAVADKVLHADVIPYTNAAGVADTWQVATAVGYMTGKSREAVTELGVIAENTAPPAA